MRTSDTDPIRIDAVALPSGGRIGLTFCPGKRDPHGSGGGWWRDLDADLDALHAAGTRALVCLLEPHELALLAVPALPDAVRSRGMAFLHLPVRDVDVPDARFERAWPQSAAALKARLVRGELVVVHCRGGLGRSGLVAARLLTEMGVSPQAAIARVRAVRPGAIETHAQAAHVLDRATGRGN
jgi:ADP-ribosyl-[dinitrogen reductase] hydrolase